jgi:hypothetical protein
MSPPDAEAKAPEPAADPGSKTAGFSTSSSENRDSLPVAEVTIPAQAKPKKAQAKAKPKARKGK